MLHDDPTVLRHVDFMWRLLIGLGCVPACIALYFRLTIPETPRFTMDIERNVQQAASDVENFLTSGTFVVDPDAVVQRAQAPKATKRDFAAYFSKWENLKVLIGTAWSWFALDVRVLLFFLSFAFCSCFDFILYISRCHSLPPIFGTCIYPEILDC